MGLEKYKTRLITCIECQIPFKDLRNIQPFSSCHECSADFFTNFESVISQYTKDREVVSFRLIENNHQLMHESYHKMMAEREALQQTMMDVPSK